MGQYYLQTTDACNLYSIKQADFDGKDATDKIIFTEDGKYDNLIHDIRVMMVVIWNKYKSPFVSGHEYWYVTTEFKSHLKNLKVIQNVIQKEEDTCTCPYNYFNEEYQAQELLSAIKGVFKNYGIKI